MAEMTVLCMQQDGSALKDVLLSACNAARGSSLHYVYQGPGVRGIVVDDTGRAVGVKTEGDQWCLPPASRSERCIWLEPM